MPAAEGRFPSNPGRTRADERAGFNRSARWLRGLRAPRAAAAASSVAGQLPARGGSNAWAVRGNGRAWLFTGPQLGFATPELLHELEVHRPGLDARGVTPPGLPVVGIGRNDHIAWGLTSGLTDDDDLYAERLRGRERYRFKGRTRRMRCRNETFAVAGAEPRRERLCRTVHGPVQARSGSRTAWARRYATWNHEIDTLIGLAELNEADSVAQAGRAIAKVSWNENTMVADDDGNIGWWHPGRLPIRPRRWDERLPLPGTGEAEWRGFLRPAQRPHVVNPDRGWLVNWNNLPSAGWTVGDGPAKERTIGRLHRAAYLARLVDRVAENPSYSAVKGVDRDAGTHAQQRALLDGRIRAAARRRDRPREGAARRDRGLGRLVRDDRRRRHGRPGRRRLGGAQGRGGAHAPARVTRLARRPRPLARVRLRRRRRRGVPAPRHGRRQAGRGARGRRAQRALRLG